MTNIITRSTVCFIKSETTENTPVAPAGATDAVSLLDGFSMTPSIEELQTTLLRGSIGAAKSIAGAEDPAVSLPGYLKGSGVEGTAPEWDLLAKAAFGNQKTAASQFATTGASSTTTLASTAASTNFIRGEALLIKDATNGYRIRHVHSFPTADSIALSFKVPTAPATSTNLGKAVTFFPANTGHPSLTIWLYLGNGGAVEMASGCRVTTLNIGADAGKIVTMDYALTGLGFYWDPIEITASTRFVDFTDDDGTFAAAVTAKFYKTPHDLAAAIQTAMNAANAGETHTVVYSNTTGKFTFTSTGTVLSLLWNTGTNTANTIATKVGFSAAADSTGTAAATGYTSASALTLTAPYTPTYDASDPIVAKNQEFMIGDQADYVCFEPSSIKFTLTDTKAIQGSICAESGRAGSTVTQREATMDVVALVSQYDADKMNRYLNNSDTRAQYSWGEKSGGNWVAGKCGGLYMATATVTKFEAVDLDGYVSMNLSIKCYVDANGNGEVYLATL